MGRAARSGTARERGGSTPSAAPKRKQLADTSDDGKERIARKVDPYYLIALEALADEVADFLRIWKEGASPLSKHFFSDLAKTLERVDKLEKRQNRWRTDEEIAERL